MALANDFKTLTWIANKGLAYLLTNLPFITCGNSEYQPEFDNREYAKGDSILIRRSNRRVGGEGATIALDGVIEKTETLTIEKQFNDGMSFTTKEQSLFQTGEYGRDIYAERYIYPSINRLVHQVNSYIGAKVETDTNLYYGSAGSPINSAQTLALIRAKMEDMNMPMDQEKYLIMTPTDGAQLKSALVNYFNPTFNKGIGERYFLQEAMGFQIETTSGIKRHTCGTAYLNNASNTVSGTVSSGTTVVLAGTNGDTVVAGDIFTVADSYLIAPTTYGTTTHLAQFVVVTGGTVSGGILSMTVALMANGIIIDTTNPFLNLSAAITAGKAITFLNSHNCNLAMVKGGLSYAAPRMQKMWTPFCVDVTDTKFGTGISLRLSRGADIVNDLNIMRWDLLFGAKIHPEYAIRVIS